MATDFTNTQVTLIINRLRTDDFAKLSKLAIENSERYIMQGRDENKGEFIPQESTIKYGSTEAKLLNDNL